MNPENVADTDSIVLPPAAQAAWRSFWDRQAEYLNRFDRCKAAFTAGYNSSQFRAVGMRLAEKVRECTSLEAKVNDLGLECTILEAKVKSLTDSLGAVQHLAERRQQALEGASHELKRAEERMYQARERAERAEAELREREQAEQEQRQPYNITVQAGGVINILSDGTPAANATAKSPLANPFINSSGL